MSSEAPRGVPFVRAADPPSTPPAVALVVNVAGRAMAVAGSLYTTDWAARDARMTQAPAKPVPWPPSVTVPYSQPGFSLVFSADVPPDWILVRSFEDVDSRDGEPRSQAVAEFDCGKLNDSRCKFGSPGASVAVVGLEDALLRGRYLTAWASWFVPRSRRPSVADGPAEVAASWLFHVERESPP